jgi:hypothetical protein
MGKNIAKFMYDLTHMELFCLDALEVLADGGLLSGLRAPVAQQEGDPTQVLHLTNHSLIHVSYFIQSNL